VLKLEPQIKQWVSSCVNNEGEKPTLQHRVLYFVGYGANTSTAYEVALKLKETCYVNCEGFQLEQFLHGPIVAADSTAQVTVLLSSPATSSEYCSDKTKDSLGATRANEIIQLLTEIGSKVVVLQPQGRAENPNVQQHLFTPDLPEELSPLSMVVAFQLFTYWLAVELKCHPDTFRLHESLRSTAFSKVHL
jgi:glucosamine 6-phosphate synthetase-like amidotransferase/phosphosugar isomerase protein